MSAEVVVRGVKSDELRVRAPEGELPQERRALRGLRLPGSPDEHLLSSETSLQFCLEEAQGSSWHKLEKERYAIEEFSTFRTILVLMIFMIITWTIITTMPTVINMIHDDDDDKWKSI